MTKIDRQKEKNFEMLLRAGYPAEGRLDPRLRGAAYSRLRKHLLTRPVFPTLALVLICSILLLLSALFAVVLIGNYHFLDRNPLIYLAGGVLLLNLMCLPIASILIVIRRKHA